MRTSNRIVAFDKSLIKKIDLPSINEKKIVFSDEIANADIIENALINEGYHEIFMTTYRISKLTTKRLESLFEHLKISRKIKLVVSDSMISLCKPEFEMINKSSIFNVKTESIHAKIIGIRTLKSFYIVLTSENMSSKYNKIESHIILNDKKLFFSLKSFIDDYYIDDVPEEIKENKEKEPCKNISSGLKNAFYQNKWTEEEAIKLLFKAEEWLREPQNFQLTYFFTFELGLYPDVCNYLSNKYNSFSKLYAQLRAMCEAKKVMLGLSDKLNPQFLKFDLINNFKWRERIENLNTNLNTEFSSDDALKLIEEYKNGRD